MRIVAWRAQPVDAVLQERGVVQHAGRLQVPPFDGSPGVPETAGRVRNELFRPLAELDRITIAADRCGCAECRLVAPRSGAGVLGEMAVEALGGTGTVGINRSRLGICLGLVRHGVATLPCLRFLEIAAVAQAVEGNVAGGDSHRLRTV